MMLNTLDAPRRPLPEIDYALLWSTLLLLFAGMVMVYSASIAIAEAGRLTGHQPVAAGAECAWSQTGTSP